MKQDNSSRKNASATRCPELIDMVYLWVDGNDPALRARREAFIGKPQDGSAANCKGRFQDNDELKYSLRSIELYAPWINKIFIVTDNQVPAWLDTSNHKISIINQNSILPEEAVPCFNSNVIEHNLYKIPGLSEKFLYANDDMFLNSPVTPDMFFDDKGRPVVRLDRRPFKRLLVWYKERVLGRTLEPYNKAIDNAARLTLKKYGRYFNDRTHHNIDAYLKSSVKSTHEMFKKEIESTFVNHMRAQTDVHRNIYSYVDIIENRGAAVYVDRSSSLRFLIHKHELYDLFDSINPVFFCMNDSQFATDKDRERAKEFMQTRFPDKSEFEK